MTAFFLWQCCFCFFPSQHRHRNCRCQCHVCNKRRSKNVSRFGLFFLEGCLWIPLSPLFTHLFWKDAALWRVSGTPGHLYQDVCLLSIQRLCLEKWWAMASKPRWEPCLDIALWHCRLDSALPTTGSHFYLDFPPCTGRKKHKPISVYTNWLDTKT